MEEVLHIHGLMVHQSSMELLQEVQMIYVLNLISLEYTQGQNSTSLLICLVIILVINISLVFREKINHKVEILSTYAPFKNKADIS